MLSAAHHDTTTLHRAVLASSPGPQVMFITPPHRHTATPPHRHTATEGTGGMAVAGSNVQPFTAISWIIVGQDKLVYVMSHYSEFWNNASYTKYEADLKKGITSSTLYLCDGGSFSVLSVLKPDASAHEIKMQGPRHNPPTWNPITFLKSASTLYLKTK